MRRAAPRTTHGVGNVTYATTAEQLVNWVDYLATIRSNGKTIDGPLVHWMTLHNGKLATFDEFEHETHDGWT